MRLVVQKVNNCKVIDQSSGNFNEIENGLLVYIGISKDCSEEKLKRVAEKLVKIRVFPGKDKNFEKSIKDVNGEILIISNFTLFGFLKGNRPNFKKSLEYEKALNYFDFFVNLVKKNYDEHKIKTGFFGAKMLVKSEIDGPTNLVLDF